MATYKYQQNMFDGASEGYVKYNITPDLGTVVSAGTTITITGQAYHKNRANKSIEIITIASNTYRSAFVNVNIPKATVTNFTLKFQMWELSSAWGTSRVVNALINFTLWSGANCDGNGDGTFNTNSQAIRYLTYRISPAAKTVQFERYALSGSTYVKNDEGTKVMGKLAISLAEGRTVSDITTAKVVVASDAGRRCQGNPVHSDYLHAAVQVSREITLKLWVIQSRRGKTSESNSACLQPGQVQVGKGPCHQHGEHRLIVGVAYREGQRVIVRRVERDGREQARRALDITVTG